MLIDIVSLEFLSDTTPMNSAAVHMLDEFRNKEPSETDYAEIGRIAVQHSSLEYQLESLVWRYMGDVDKGHIATARMGIREITDVLKTLVDWTEPDDALADSIEWGIQCFHELRLKRNRIIHGFNFSADQKSGKLFIEGRTRSIVFDAFDQFEICRKTLQRVTEEQVLLSMFLYDIHRHIDRRGLDAIGHDRPPPSELFQSSAKPPLPEKMTPIDRDAPKSIRRQRAELEATNAKRAKSDSKNAQRAAQRAGKE